jgi:hypothetical protein
MTVVIAESQNEALLMIVFARGSIAEPDALAPHIEDEMRVVDQPKADGVMTTAYRRAAGPGVDLRREGSSLNAVRERVDALLFVVEALMTPRLRDLHPTRPVGPQTSWPVAARARGAPSPQATSPTTPLQ